MSNIVFVNQSCTKQVTYAVHKNLSYIRMYHDRGNIKWFEKTGLDYIVIEDDILYERAHIVYQTNGPLSVFALRNFASKDVIGIIMSKLILLVADKI